MHDKLSHFDGIGGSKKFSISPDVSVKQMFDILGTPNAEDDPDKVRWSWAVRHEDGRELYVWDYKGARWSGDGDIELAKEVFGADKVEPLGW